MNKPLTADQIWDPIEVPFRRGRFAGRSYTVDPRRLSRENLRRCLEVGARTILSDAILLNIDPAEMLGGVKRND